MATTQQPVKFSFTDSTGRKLTGFWNGKVYGTKIYASLSKEAGRDVKISFDSATHRCDAGNWSVGVAKEAFHHLAAKGIAPFSQFDFSDFTSGYAYEK